MKYKYILFDWGNTLMVDSPSDQPMVAWPVVEAVAGAGEVLRRLGTQATLIVATSASISDESQIRAALARVGLDTHIQRIYCFKNTGLKKSPAFYQYILQDLGAAPAQAVMVGDSFENDVLAANQAGLYAIWFNPDTNEKREADRHTTIHALPELPPLLIGASS
ncbi:MAG: HAD family hydrolase [Anaerolineales bacterium]